MPHITLTSFFQVAPEQLEAYQEYLTDALATHQPVPTPVLQIMGLILRPEFHGLEVRAPHWRCVPRNAVPVNLAFYVGRAITAMLTGHTTDAMIHKPFVHQTAHPTDNVLRKSEAIPLF